MQFSNLISIQQVDATVESDVASKFQVQGYPTLKFFRAGTPSEYGGGRTAPEIVAWLNKKTGPPATALATEADLTVNKLRKLESIVHEYSKFQI